MHVRTALCAAAAAALAACGGGDDAPRVERVILVTCDTLRADRLGVYGYDRDVSPRLDAFARECVVFEEAYSCAPMTQPAVASLLSGRLPTEVGASPGNVRLMPSDVVTLAERARAEGLATGAVVSNWILKRPNPAQGDVGVQQGFDHFDDRMPNQELVRRNVRERVAKDTTDAAIAMIERFESNGSDAFLLWVHYQDPHGPYTPPKEYRDLFQSPRDVEPALEIGPDHLGRGCIPDYQALFGIRDPAVYRDLYDAEVRYFDTELGRLLDDLRERGLFEDSLFVFTSDHGESLGEHDYWFSHGETVYREVVRVPLLVRWPGGGAPSGFPAAGDDGVRRSARLASHLDVVPTVLDALRVIDRGARGVSLLREPPPEGRVLPQDLWPTAGRPRWWAASDGAYRCLWSEELEGPRLFDVRSDPGETNDLAATEPERAAELRARHAAFLARGETRTAEEMQLSDEDREALDALGYGGEGGSD